jgi:hypothetical protein
VLLGITLWLNDRYVRKREAVLQKSAKTSMAVVHSLFPETVRDRILEEGLASSSSQRRLSISRRKSSKHTKTGSSVNVGESNSMYHNKMESGVAYTPPPTSLSSSIASSKTSSSPSNSHETADAQPTVESAVISSTVPVRTSKPIADFFQSATVLFADVVGFTAWASIREPSQVFALLEAIFNSFDKIGKKKNVFKVEVRIRV